MTLLDELGADRPYQGEEKALDLYGRLVGTWDVVDRSRRPDGEWVTGTVVWTFGWVLAGRAVQDVMWFTTPGPDGYPLRTTGSTMRLYDPATDHWHIVWFSPQGWTKTLTGRPGDDGDIHQEGRLDDGTIVRWLFTELTESSFRWLGYISTDDGETWDLEQEMLARRRPD
ncbi:hypothetical protein [Actinoplanes regularis]|uniref:DUF1579 domain-containing protein n=1 Tax=Actinoplanes regularis TaxID=52697 RepID=A0A239B8C9_9ACTN|nr:hypothetical protein [Actinoplanes regularis]GIE87830.1 hypothetical protein Are01nite_43100 [Actinoplanes regularis]SNS04177.1 hypothetical protein SAMN06264365_10935 [Actinoplanes regularis]